MIETAEDLARQYRNGELSPTACIDRCLQRIDCLNPDLHAFSLRRAR
jgi:Asp-tRNA(Asn)/Glu-tRNA(Gln) amidotransferase A subunit family amidase